MAERLVKYCNSLKEVMLVLFLKTSPKLITLTASAKLNSPSALVSQLATQRAFTLASAKVILPSSTKCATKSISPNTTNV